MSRKKLHPAVIAYIREMTSKGGRARAEALSPIQRKRIARKGGRAAQAKLSPEQRSEAARRAVQARWKRWRAARASKQQ
jgi:hypothetical protein